MLKPTSCDGCPLVNISDGFSVESGDGTNGVVILGDSLSYGDYIDGLPLTAKTQGGSKLEEAFRQASRELGYPVSRNQFKIYNVVNCHPKGEYVPEGAISYCASNVERVVGGFSTNKQKTILALGNIPLKYLTGMSGVAEEKQSINHLRGYVFESKYGLVVPSYHPSFIRRGNNHLTPILVEDLKKALGVAKGVYTNHTFHKGYKPPDYQITPSIGDAESFYYKVRDSQKLVLTYDIETPRTGDIDEDERDDLDESDITLTQFSLQRGSGIALPFRDGYIDVIKRIFACDINKANHNTWNFDNPRLRAKEVIIKGKTHDTMWMFKHWHPRLPRGLQSVASLFGFPFPWKHLYGTQLEWYGCADVDAVQWIINALPPLMKAKGVWDGYKDHVYNIHPILERASVVGIPVSEEKRLQVEKDFTVRRAVLDKDIQGIIPDECRNIKPKRKDKETGEVDYGYIREPKTVGIERDTYERLSKELLARGKRIATFEDYLYRKHNLAYCEFRELVEGVEERVIGRWAIIEPFKASKEQLTRYLRFKQRTVREEAVLLRAKRTSEFGGRNPELTGKINALEELADDYEVPTVKDKKTKKEKETTAKKELEEMYLNTGDPILEKVVQIRSYDTNLNNYLPNWKPGKDGRVHTTWGFTAPTGQFDARRPNILNCSKHTEFGNEFRGIIEAPKGYTFVEFDFKSYHVATMGYCANDKDYIRFSQIDPHSILGSYIDPSILGGSISLKWSDADILEAASKFKKICKTKGKETGGVDVRQALAKPTVLGNQLELGAKKLQRQNRRFIKYVTRQEREYHKEGGLSAEELQDVMNRLFPKPVVYKKYIKEKAFTEGYLVNEFGYIQYFNDIFAFVFNEKLRKWDRREGEGAREPIAFRVQGCAFGKIHLDLLELERQGINERYNFINSIHDSVIYMPRTNELEKCIISVSSILCRACKWLSNESTGKEGLIVGVECAVGTNWKDYDKDNNPGGMQEVKI